MTDTNTWMIFDFDGTLADSFRLAHRIFNQLAGRYHFKPVEEYEVDDMRCKTAKQFFAARGVSLIKLPFLAMQARIELYRHISEVNPIPGIVDVLATLHENGIRMGVLTSNSTDNVNAFLNTNSIERFFDFTHCAHDMFGKAHKIKALIRKFKLTPEHIIYIGDMDADIEAAHQANIRVAAVSWGYQARSILADHNPTWLLDNPEQLLTLPSE